MTSSKGARTVIYDGDCGFCTRSVRLARALDWFGLFEWCSRWEDGVRERFPQLPYEDSLRQMYVVRPDGKLLGGFYCVRYLWLHLPLLCVPALLMHLPYAGLLGEPVYRWIARNRHRFGGRKDCSLPPGRS